MSFPRYERYKDSGVEWLGEVPEGWTLPKLKHIATFKGGGTPNRDVPSFWNGDIPWVSPKDMKSEKIEGAEESITELGLNSCSSALLPMGQVLLVVRSGILKHTIPVAINTVPVALNQDMKALQFESSICHSSFFLRWVQGLNDLLLLCWAKQGATVESIEQAYLAETVIPMPPMEEQWAITKFLEQQISKINGLVHEQERLIVLLKEKRQAMISHAVTKGLDPDAPMKDSGIEWLGEVPQAWEVMKFSKLILKIEQGWSPVASSEPCELDSWGVLKLGAIKNGAFVPGENKMLLEGSDPDPAIEVKPGDLLLTRGNTPELVGDACVVTEFTACRLMLSDLIYRVLLKPNNDPNFFCNLLISGYGRSLIETDARGSSMSMVKISQGHIGSWIIPVPPPGEQSAIAAFINSETAKIDTLVAEAKRAIDLLRERRTALVSAAVTGKIDVRGLVVTKSE